MHKTPYLFLRLVISFLVLFGIYITTTHKALAQTRPFITTWQTTTDNESIIIPTYDGESYNYTVDWGDGTVDTGQTGDATHAYTTAGTYTVSISGDFPRIYVDRYNVDPDDELTNSNKITSIDQWGDIQWTSMEGSFAGCSNLLDKALDSPNLLQVTSTGSMFYASSFNGDISNWDVSNVSNMVSMFSHSTFNGNISNWDVSNVSNMNHMFSSSTFNGDISNWDVSNVSNMKRMFYYSSFNGDISNWDVSNVSDMSIMLAASPFNGDISNWDVSNVSNMSGMFSQTSFNRDISGWDVSNVSDMISMFSNSTFNGDISNWDVSNVSNMNHMFYYSTFNGDISNWDVSNVSNMNHMFYYSTFNGDISNWDVSNVSDMSHMFSDMKYMRSHSTFNGDISNWNVSNVTDMENIFNEVKLPTDAYDAILNNWSKLALQNGVTFDGGDSQYSSKGAVARQKIIDTYGWEISDGGQNDEQTDEQDETTEAIEQTPEETHITQEDTNTAQDTAQDTAQNTNTTQPETPPVEKSWQIQYRDKLLKQDALTDDDIENYHDRTTRAEFAKLIARAFDIQPTDTGAIPFADIKTQNPYHPYIIALKEMDIIQGQEGNFYPDRKISRVEALKILFLGANLQIGQDTNTGFTDIPQDTWYAPYVSYSRQQKIVNGYEDGLFRPSQGITRSESWKIVSQVLDI